MKKIEFFILLIITGSSCSEDIALTFSEDNFTSEKFAIIDVNIPIAEGNSELTNKINGTIKSFVANAIDFKEDGSTKASIEESAASFDDEYKLFSEKFSEVTQPWEAFVDGEVTYNSPEVISVAFNTYINTGGAHGNSIISFLNFNPSTGGLYTNEDVIDYLDKFNALVEKHFEKAIKEESNSTEASISFKLPETIGFSEDGVIIVYNQYELEDYSKNMLEFTIPYSELSEVFNLNF